MVTHFPRLNYGRLIFLLYRRNLDTSQPSDSRDPVPPLLKPAQTRLSFGSGLLTLFTHRGALKTHLTRTRQLLTRGPKGLLPPNPLPSSLPSSFPSSLRSSLLSSLLSLRSLSHLSSKDLSFSFPLQIFTSAQAEFCTPRAPSGQKDAGED
jgi:hypothetical protein